MCGENELLAIYTAQSSGSSPRVRGKHGSELHHGKLTRLIPACAGKTVYTPRPVPPNRAHPRVCGENQQPASTNRQQAGSSPRVRGKLDAVAKKLEITGLIPACAGKTPFQIGPTDAEKAHPRVCGENAFSENALADGGGSSPRVRGKQ